MTETTPTTPAPPPPAPPVSASAGGRFRDALRARELRLLLGSFLADSVGSWAYSVVVVVYVFDRTGSPGLIAVTTACSWLPRLLISSYAGVLADRYERTRIMVLSAAGCALLMAVMAGAVAGDAPVALVLVLHAAAAACSTFNGPASRALIPETVAEKDLAAANALFGVLDNLVVVVGPAIGAVLLLTGEPALGVAFNGLTFVAAVALGLRLRVRSSGGAEEGEGLLGQLATGVSALRAEPVALVLVLYCALGSAVYGALTVFYVPLSVEFGTGTEGYGYLIASMAAGGVLAGGLVNRLAAYGRLAPLIVGGMLALALPVAASVLVSAPLAAALLQGVAGVGMVVVDVLAVTALQRDLPRAVLSRVFGLLDTAALGGTLLASLVASLLLAATSLDTALLVLGLGFSVLAVLGAGPLLRADARAVEAVAALRPKVAMLELLDLFAAAPRTALEQLARSVEELQLPAGTVVLREGDPADALYVVVAGEVAVSARGEAARARRLRTLGPRSYVGEIGLLRGGVRTATVTTLEDTVLWRVSGADFVAALESSAPSASMLGVAGARLSRSHPALAAEPFTPPAPAAP